MSAALDWAESYRRAWLAGDGHAAGSLYAKDCRLRSALFRESEDARAYMVRVFAEAEARDVWFGPPFEHGDRAAIEYWAMLVEPDGTKSTIAGCHLINFGADGLVAEASDYWQLEDGHLQPPPGWGR